MSDPTNKQVEGPQLKPKPDSNSSASDGRSRPIDLQKAESLMNAVIKILDRQELPHGDSNGDQDQKQIWEFENFVWTTFGCEDPLVPEVLLKECQKALKTVGVSKDPKLDGVISVSSAGDRGDRPLEPPLLEIFARLLNRLHKSRKKAAKMERFQFPFLPPKFLQLCDPVQYNKSPSASPFPNTTNTFPSSRVWGLIFGNNRYHRNIGLRGSIRDSELVYSYCKHILHIPDNHIILIHDATRAEMISALYDLRDNAKIQPGDAVLIYYSGHGTSYDTDAYQFPNSVAKILGSIEALCPVDRSELIPDISDREFNNILNEIYQEKEAKIIVILDCCHSGGAVRISDDSEDGSIIRYISPLTCRTNGRSSTSPSLQAMLQAADTHPRRREHSPVTNNSSWVGDIDNLVLLAACQDFQVSVEIPLEVPELCAGETPPSPQSPRPKMFYGRFTHALHKALTSKSAVPFPTFQDLIAFIGKIDETQVPVALGGHRNHAYGLLVEYM